MVVHSFLQIKNKAISTGKMPANIRDNIDIEKTFAEPIPNNSSQRRPDQYQKKLFESFFG